MYFYLMFLPFWYTKCVIIQYPQSKREILCQNEEQYSVELHDFFSYFMSYEHIFKRFIIYQSGITMNIRNTQSKQCYPIFSLIYFFFSIDTWIHFSIRHMSIRHNYFFKDKPHYLFHRRFFCTIRRLKVAPAFM